MLIKQSIFKSLALLSHVSDLELFNDAIHSYKDGHPDVRYAGAYRRIMISVSSGEREEIPIMILRIHNVDTNGIHSYPALLPDILSLIVISGSPSPFGLLPLL